MSTAHTYSYSTSEGFREVLQTMCNNSPVAAIVSVKLQTLVLFRA